MPNPTSSPVIIITGASKGLGLSITKILLHTFGAKVIAVSRTISEELKGLVGHSGSSDRLVFVQGDVTDPLIPVKAVDTALTKWGRLDGLVLNAGTIDPLGPVSDPNNTSTQWSEAFSTNLFSLVSMLQHVTPHLRRPSGSSDQSQADKEEVGQGGNVVFVSSGAATGNTAGWGCYNATKAALNSLCRTYANEERSIASFAVRPGMVDTDMQTKLRANGGKGMLPEEMERFVNAHKEGKLLKPEDPGYVIAALAVKGQEVHDLSGQFLSWNDAALAAYQRPQ